MRGSHRGLIYVHTTLARTFVRRSLKELIFKQEVNNILINSFIGINFVMMIHIHIDLLRSSKQSGIGSHRLNA
jgi:hypothetical protein